MDQDWSFGEWLRRSRKAHDLTQAELAQQIGCATGTIRKLEADELRPSKEIAARLAAHFAVPPAERAAFVGFARGQADAPALPLPPLRQSSGPVPQHAPPASPPNNLPLQPTPFIGREREVERIRQRLLQPEGRLVTMTGPGGTGKTRLSVQVAAGLLNDFADGVFIVALAPITDPGLVPAAIAGTLGVRETAGTSSLESLKDALHEKQLLLVLDNFEQVAPAASVVAELLGAAPRLRVLVTSRVPLHLRGEREVAVPPLALPDPRHPPPAEQLRQYDAVRLFIDRAQDVQAEFAVTNENAPAVAEICARLDGLPLAIELAAARIKLLPPQALLARLQHRLKLLTGGARDRDPRQQTLRGTIDWSYNLLAADEQRLFARLAVFAGGWTVEAAEQVCNGAGDLQLDVVDGLQSLLDNSLVRVLDETGAPTNDEPRYTMLETIREYALERLYAAPDAEAIRREAAAYFLQLAETAAPLLQGPEQFASTNRLHAEVDNLRAVHEWALARHELDIAARLAVALWYFFHLTGRSQEGLRWLETVLAATEGSAISQMPPVLRAQVLFCIADLAWRTQDVPRARSLAEASLRIWEELGDTMGRASASHVLGNIALEENDVRAAATWYERAVALYEEAGSPVWLAWGHNDLGRAAMMQRDYSRARVHFEQALRLHRTNKNVEGIADALRLMGEVAHLQGDAEQAGHYLHESVALHLSMGATIRSTIEMASESYALWLQGEYARATSVLRQCVEMAAAAGDTATVAWFLLGLAWFAADEGDYVRALAEGEQSLKLLRAHRNPRDIADALTLLGEVANVRGDATAARRYYAESLAIYHDLRMPWYIARSLVGLAWVAGGSGAVAEGDRRAARLLGVAETLAAASNPSFPGFAFDQAHYDRILAAARSGLDETAYAADWAAGREMTLEEAIAEALKDTQRG